MSCRVAVLAAALWPLSAYAASLDRSDGARRVSRTSPRRSNSISSLESISRIESLDSRLRRQREVMERLEERIADVERGAPKEFEILHYNILANSSGTNMQPWFCYGANVTSEERAELHKRFYAKGEDGWKRHATKGWPRWAEGILSPERRAAIERCALPESEPQLILALLAPMMPTHRLCGVPSFQLPCICQF